MTPSRDPNGRRTVFNSTADGIQMSIPHNPANIRDDLIYIDLHSEQLRDLHRAVSGTVHRTQTPRPGGEPFVSGRRFVEVMCCPRPGCGSTSVKDRTPAQGAKVGYWFCESCKHAWQEALGEGLSVRVKPARPIPGDPAHLGFFPNNGGPRRPQSKMVRVTRRIAKAASILLLIGVAGYFAARSRSSSEPLAEEVRGPVAIEVQPVVDQSGVRLPGVGDLLSGVIDQGTSAPGGSTVIALVPKLPASRPIYAESDVIYYSIPDQQSITTVAMKYYKRAIDTDERTVPAVRSLVFELNGFDPNNEPVIRAGRTLKFPRMSLVSERLKEMPPARRS